MRTHGLCEKQIVKKQGGVFLAYNSTVRVTRSVNTLCYNVGYCRIDAVDEGHSRHRPSILIVEISEKQTLLSRLIIVSANSKW